MLRMKRKLNFSSIYFKSKKGIATFVNFSLLLLIFISLFLGITLYENSKLEDIQTQKDERIALERAIHLRTYLVSISVINNSKIEYTNPLSSSVDVISLQNSLISSSSSGSRVNVSTLGTPFCSIYTLYPILKTNISFNGTCIAIT